MGGAAGEDAAGGRGDVGAVEVLADGGAQLVGVLLGEHADRAGGDGLLARGEHGHGLREDFGAEWAGGTDAREEFPGLQRGIHGIPPRVTVADCVPSTLIPAGPCGKAPGAPLPSQPTPCRSSWNSPTLLTPVPLIDRCLEPSRSWHRGCGDGAVQWNWPALYPPPG